MLKKLQKNRCNGGPLSPPAMKGRMRMKKQKKIIISIAILLFMCLFVNTKAYAASIGMGISKSTAYIGDTFTVTISGINGKVNISSNSNVTIDKAGSYFVEGSLTITGTAKSEGTGTITVTPVDVTTTAAEPEQITTAASRSITITQKPTPTPSKTTTTTTKKTSKPTPKPDTTPTPTEDNFYISTLSLKGIKENGDTLDIVLSPEFNKDTYEYTCNVPSDVEKIELDKDAGDYTNSISIEGLEKLEEGENIITLKLTSEGHEDKIYTIKVIKEPKFVNNEDVVETSKDMSMITMPVWSFVLLQIIIIVVEIIGLTIISNKKKRGNH